MEEELSPEERIKLLLKKKESLKKAIEEKKKELEELKKKVESEEEFTEEELRKSFEELLLEEEEQLKELEKRLRKAQEVDGLEGVVESESSESGSSEVVGELPNPDYVAALESVVAGTANIYSLADSSLYRELKRLEEKPYLTREEQELLSAVVYKVDAVKNSYSSDELREKDPLYYVDRVENVAKRLLNNLYKPKD